MSAKEPTIRAATGTFAGYTRARIDVHAGLHRIGEQAPYFTLTCDILQSGHMVAGGCMHREIVKRWPELADIAAMHLSSIDGVPLHAEANGWYQLAGALDGMGEQYHAGNGKRQHWAPDGEFLGYRESTREECLQSFAEHCRITLDEAKRIAFKVKTSTGTNADKRREFGYLIDAMRPRWKQEAEACIAKHSLKVFGDPEPKAVSA